MSLPDVYLNSDLDQAWRNQDIFETVSTLEGEVFRHKEGRKTLRFKLNGNSYFLKYHRGIGWWEIIKNYLQLRAPITGAKNEWQAIQFLTELGIDTMTLAGYGEQGNNPATKQSFVITEDLSHTMDLEKLAEQWYQRPPTFQTKTCLIKKLAGISKKMHENGMNHRDFYLVHFLIDKQFAEHNMITEQTKLYLIDLHRALIHPNKKVPERWLVKDLGSLYFSAMDIRLTQRDLFRFMMAYSGKSLRELSSDMGFWRKVGQRALTLRNADNAVVIESLNPLRGFLKGNRELDVPFNLEIVGQQYQCQKVLRLLPKKRLVIEATSAKHHAVVKFFAEKYKGRREIDREYDGYKAAKAAGVNVPEFISVAVNQNGCLSIAYQYIEGAQTLLSLTREQRLSYCPALFETVAFLHAYGIYQEDLHLDNFLVADGKLYLIDLGSIRMQEKGKGLSPKKSLQNLARLVSEFCRDEQALMTPFIQSYYRHRRSNYNEIEQNFFAKYLHKAWQRRKRNYLNKQFRNCSMTKVIKTKDYQAAFRRHFVEDVDGFIGQIEQYIEQGEPIKTGNSATVVKTMVDGKAVVVKRYNIKDKQHFISRCWRPSRAAISWRNANLLEFLDIPTATPLGYIEKRCFGLRSTAYFISEYHQADPISTVFENREPKRTEVDQIRNLFRNLAQEKLSHGDFKASNLLMDEKGVVRLIDLDAMTQHQHNKGFEKAFMKDKMRFIANWQETPLANTFQFLKTQ